MCEVGDMVPERVQCTHGWHGVIVGSRACHRSSHRPCLYSAGDALPQLVLDHRSFASMRSRRLLRPILLRSRGGGAGGTA